MSAKMKHLSLAAMTLFMANCNITPSQKKLYNDLQPAMAPTLEKMTAFEGAHPRPHMETFAEKAHNDSLEVLYFFANRPDISGKIQLTPDPDLNKVFAIDSTGTTAAFSY